LRLRSISPIRSRDPSPALSSDSTKAVRGTAEQAIPTPQTRTHTYSYTVSPDRMSYRSTERPRHRSSSPDPSHITFPALSTDSTNAVLSATPRRERPASARSSSSAHQPYHPPFQPQPTSLDLFPYSPLPEGQDAIRLLTLEPHSGVGFPLVGNLRTVTFAERSRYFALSYTWDVSHSDAIPDDSISSNPNHPQIDPTIMKLNDIHVRIKHNLGLALNHIRSGTQPLDIWIDAVCIQQSNRKERSAQVALMEFIYARAFKAVVWLGLAQPYHKVVPYIPNPYDLADTLVGPQATWGSPGLTQTDLARVHQSRYWTRIWTV
jgi:hypothetical protein